MKYSKKIKYCYLHNLLIYTLNIILILPFPITAFSQFPDYSDVIESVSHCVVSIVAMGSIQQGQTNEMSASFSRGTGIFLSENGYIVTNNHIVESANRYFVELNNGFVYEANLIGGDFSTDLAVLKIDISNQPICEFHSENDMLEVGDVVLSLGSPYSLPGSVSVGIVSFIDRPLAVSGEYMDYVLYIQTDLIINPGNSGGAVVNQNSKIIGMNSSTVLSTAGSSGIAFAIPAKVILKVSRQLIRDRVATKGYIGLQVTALPQTIEQIQSLGLAARRGAMVSEVDMNSPAFRAGIRAGDVVITIDRVVVENEHMYRYLISAQDSGTRVRMSLIREGNFISTEALVEGRVIEK